MTVNIAPGRVAIPTANNTGTLLCASDAVETVTLPTAPASGSNRIDGIICQARGNDVDGGANNDFIFTFVSSTVSATPPNPVVPANAVLLATVYVPGGSASVTAPNLYDVRNQAGRLAVTQQARIPVMGFYNPAIATQPTDWHGQGTIVFQANLPAIAGGYLAFVQYAMFPWLRAGTGGWVELRLDIGGTEVHAHYAAINNSATLTMPMVMSTVYDIDNGAAVAVQGKYGNAPGFGGDLQVGFQPGGLSNYLWVQTMPKLMTLA
jgi:hypothetical protein